MSVSIKVSIAILCGVLLVWLGFVFDVRRGSDTVTSPLTFSDCLVDGVTTNTVPVVCTTPDGEIFMEPVTNETELVDLIRLTSPRPEMRIKSPVIVEGFARGTWFFEGSFPVELIDSRGVVIASAPAYAQAEWMTETFVPFRAELKYTQKEKGVGRLVLKKENPSGDLTHEQSLTMLLHFLGKYTDTTATTTSS